MVDICREQHKRFGKLEFYPPRGENCGPVLSIHDILPLFVLFVFLPSGYGWRISVLMRDGRSSELISSQGVELLCGAAKQHLYIYIYIFLSLCIYASFNNRAIPNRALRTFGDAPERMPLNRFRFFFFSADFVERRLLHIPPYHAYPT